MPRLTIVMKHFECGYRNTYDELFGGEYVSSGTVVDSSGLVSAGGDFV